jgi:hypothetical protein
LTFEVAATLSPAQAERVEASELHFTEAGPSGKEGKGKIENEVYNIQGGDRVQMS